MKEPNGKSGDSIADSAERTGEVSLSPYYTNTTENKQF